MILDQLYADIAARIMADPVLAANLKVVDWYNQQPAAWEQGGGMEGLPLPCVLVDLGRPDWRRRGNTRYMADVDITLHLVRQQVDDPMATDRDPALVAATRASYDLLHRLAAAVRGLRRADADMAYTTLGVTGMATDNDYQRLRVDQVMLRTHLAANKDLNTYTTVPRPPLTVQGVGTMNGDPDACLPATWELYNSAGERITQGSIASGGSTLITAPDAQVRLNTVLVGAAAGGSTLHVPVTDTDGNPVGALNGGRWEVPHVHVPAGIHYAFGRHLFSNQTQQYATYDEWWLYNTGWFDYTPPTTPLHVATLATWYTLAAPNIHGNTLRFTTPSGDEITAPSATEVIQDHLTGLEFIFFRNAGNAIDAATFAACVTPASYGGNVYYATPIGVLLSLLPKSNSAMLNRPILTNPNLRSSSTPADNTVTTYRALPTGNVDTVSKTNGGAGTGAPIRVRRFAH